MPVLLDFQEGHDGGSYGSVLARFCVECFSFLFSLDDAPLPLNPIHTQPLNKMLYATGYYGLYTLDLNNLNVPLPFNWIPQTLEVYSECAFSADFTVLYGSNPEQGGVFQIIDQQTGAITPLTFNADPVVYDLGGSSFYGAQIGECYTQYARVKTRVRKAAKRGGYLRYSVQLKNTSKTLASLDTLRLEVTLPAQVSIVSSSTNLRKHGVVGTVNAGTLEWGDFKLTRHKTARFDFKARVASSAVKGQVLTLNTTLYQEGTKCPQTTSSLVRT